MFNRDAFINHHAVNANTGFHYQKNIYDGYVTDAEGKQWGWIQSLNLYEQAETGIRKDPAQFQLMNIDILGYGSNDGDGGSKTITVFNLSGAGMIFGNLYGLSAGDPYFTTGTALGATAYYYDGDTSDQDPTNPPAGADLVTFEVFVSGTGVTFKAADGAFTGLSMDIEWDALDDANKVIQVKNTNTGFGKEYSLAGISAEFNFSPSYVTWFVDDATLSGEILSSWNAGDTGPYVTFQLGKNLF